MDWSLLSSLGSAALVWPLALVLGLVLFPTARRPADVGLWLLSLGLASVLVAGVKVAFYGWGTGVPAWDLTCFSGHAMMAAAFWPVAFASLLDDSVAGRRAGAMVGLGLAAAVAASRVFLQAHPPSEALAGWLLGTAVAAMGLRALGGGRPAPGRRAWVSGLVLSAMLMGLGHWVPHLPSEQWFQRLAVLLSGREHPVDRQRWRAPAIPGTLTGLARPAMGAEYNARLA